MPITKELKNVRSFESVGFSHDQAETLADVIEESHADSHENLKEVIRNEFDKQNKDIDLKLGALDNKLTKQISTLDNKLSTQISGLDNKLSAQISGLDNKLSAQISGLDIKISNLEVSIIASQKDLLIKLFGIIVGTVGIAVTIIKLF